MTEVLKQTGVSEVMLLFVLIFVVPMLVLMLRQMRRYERLYGKLPEAGKKGGRKTAPEPAPAAKAAEKIPVPADVWPYRTRPFLTGPEKSCLEALREALGAEVAVFPKVALWEMVEPTEKDPGYRDRLLGKDFDFLVCDRKTLEPLTAVLFNPGKGRPAGGVDDARRICDAAGANVVFIDMAENYDAESLKGALGIPQLDL